MTATPAPAEASVAAGAQGDMPNGLGWAIRNTLNEAGRHMRVIPRNPDLLIFSTLQPIMFVLLFKYVFGGSIEIPGYRYTQYLMPGIFAQTVVFGASFTAIGLAEDMSKGFVDRLRSLPISQSAILVGRTLSDTMRNIITFVVMLAVAFAVGFRFEGGLVRGIAASALLLGFSYAFSWIQALIGISVKSVEAANSAGFIWMFPMTFQRLSIPATCRVGSRPWPTSTRSRSPPMQAARCTTAAIRAPMCGKPLRGPWVSLSCLLCWRPGSSRHKRRASAGLRG